jgi:hypothetical protein
MSATLLIEQYEAFVSATRRTRERRLLEIDANIFRSKFNRRPFPLSHNIADHPLFDLPRLASLAHRLSEAESGNNTDEMLARQDARHARVPAEEIIHKVKESNSWVMIRHVERDPQYRSFLNQCINEIAEHSERLAPGVSRREGAILISSPNARLPYRINSRCVFSLQIRGGNTVTTFDQEDSSVLSEEEIERYLSGCDLELNYRDELEGCGRMFQLTPGQGLHVPVTAPHLIRNGGDVSVSLILGFSNSTIDRRAIIYSVNSILRKKGIAPTPFGRSRLRDELKYQAYRALCRLKR